MDDYPNIGIPAAFAGGLLPGEMNWLRGRDRGFSSDLEITVASKEMGSSIPVPEVVTAEKEVEPSVPVSETISLEANILSQ